MQQDWEQWEQAKQKVESKKAELAWQLALAVGQIAALALVGGVIIGVDALAEKAGVDT